MARWLTVLIALVAQGMALMAPVCMVRCVSPAGHECMELIGQDCRCFGCPSDEIPAQEYAVVKGCDCSHHEGGEQEGLTDEQVVSQDCRCLRTPIELIPQAQPKVFSSFGLPELLAFVPTMNFAATIHASDVVCQRSTLIRPHESPQLAVLATVVLRV